jgi:hypothetical protein
MLLYVHPPPTNIAPELNLGIWGPQADVSPPKQQHNLHSFASLQQLFDAQDNAVGSGTVLQAGRLVGSTPGEFNYFSSIYLILTAAQ